MSNLVLSTVCERSCSFCFGRRLMQAPASGDRFMEMSLVEQALDALVADGETEVRLLGGEPTLHPELGRCLDAAFERGLKVIVFSSGLIPEPALDHLAGSPEARCAVVINLRPPESRDVQEQRRLERVLDRLGRRVVLGATIDRLPFEPGYLLDAHRARGRDLAPYLRLGMAHPLPGDDTRALLPAQYPAVGQLLGRLAADAGREGLRLCLDCGFVRCQLDDEALESLEQHHAEIGFRCRPIPDLGPGGVAYHCLAAAELLRLDPPDEARADGAVVRQALRPRLLRERLARMRTSYDGFGIFRECSECQARLAGTCDGGCLIHRLHRLRGVAGRILEVAP